jgi:PAS domain S-box-containing protein
LSTADGEAIGEICVVSAAPFENAMAIESALRFISTRVAAEVQRLRFESAMRDQDQRFRDFAELSSDVFIRWKAFPEPHVEYVSPVWETLTGYRREQLYEDAYFIVSIVEEPYREGVLRGLREGFQGRGIVRMRTSDGRTIHVEGNPIAVRNDAGEVIGLQTVLRDVTEREEAARAQAP